MNSIIFGLAIFFTIILIRAIIIDVMANHNNHVVELVINAFITSVLWAILYYLTH